MTILGLIPARGGSKGIPGKNLRPVAGKPLLAWTADAAASSRALDRCVLSTDDEAIAKAGRAMGVEVPFIRPSELARDDTPMVDVMLHVLEWFAKAHAGEPEAVVLLQPTSPLRRAEHIDGAVRLLRSTEADAVVSVVEVPHRFHPHALMREVGGTLCPYEDGATVSRRQDKPRLLARNGPAVLVVRPAALRAGILYPVDTRPLLMDPGDSVDIDTLEDLQAAELALERHRARNP